MPLIVAIKGLVTEVSDLMTHGGMIAREYGLLRRRGRGARHPAEVVGPPADHCPVGGLVEGVAGHVRGRDLIDLKQLFTSGSANTSLNPPSLHEVPSDDSEADQ